MSNFKITTPHAAVLVWNYKDRIGVPEGKYNATGSNQENVGAIEKGSGTSPTIVSTLSCISIQTSKSKSQPTGNFQLVLAPSKNWLSTLTAGSWCVIMMSNEKITKDDIKHANPKMVKMFGRIENVRCETKVNDSGARQTLYYVSGIDWSHIFESLLYIDNLITNDTSNKNLAAPYAKALRSDRQLYDYVEENLKKIINAMGIPLDAYNKQEDQLNRLSKSIQNFSIPSEVAQFLKFKNKSNSTEDISVNQMVKLKTGSLIAYNKYEDRHEAVGFINPFSYQGANSVWNMLLENSNPAMNEMFTDMNWTDDGQLELVLYNRIKPFAYKDSHWQLGGDSDVRSYFKDVKRHNIDPINVISVNVGTNWRDKINFLEIKPNYQDFHTISNLTYVKNQVFDSLSFAREGFRPMIFDIKQFPTDGKQRNIHIQQIKWDLLPKWLDIMREWYFGTHRMLNGTMVLTGSTEYIGVGNNIRFPTSLINPNTNLNSYINEHKQHEYILAHVENVSYSFSVAPNGARTYATVVQFVRGIVVNDANQIVGDGMLDQDVSKVDTQHDYNSKNIVISGDKTDINSSGD